MFPTSFHYFIYAACPMGTYKDRVGNVDCVTCPANSAAQTMGNRMCDCEANYARPTSADASQGCTGKYYGCKCGYNVHVLCVVYFVEAFCCFPSPECVQDYFLDGGRCMPCPGNSKSSRGSADHCNCIPNHTTMNGSSTTNGERCVCQTDYFVDGTDQCVQCPANSQRNIMSSVASCVCETNHRTPDGSTTTSGALGCTG